MKQFLKITLFLSLIIITITLSVASCDSKDNVVVEKEKTASESNEKIVLPSKYSQGNVLYLKPDSLKVLVTTINTNNTVDVLWKDESGSEHNFEDVEEYTIYGYEKH